MLLSLIVTLCFYDILCYFSLSPTCALGFITPVSTVILSIALPPRRDTASVLALILEIPRATGHLSGSGCGKHNLQWKVSLTHQRSYSCWFLWCLVRKILLTTVGLVRVVAAIIHAIALPFQAHAHSICALEGVGVAHFAEFRRCGCGRRKKKDAKQAERFIYLFFFFLNENLFKYNLINN